LLHRDRWQWAKAGLHLVRRGARSAISGQDAQQRRSKKDCCQRREAAGAFAEIVCRQLSQINAVIVVNCADIVDFAEAVAMAHFADKIDRVESAVLLSLIGGSLALCALGAAAYDIGRVFSVW
jgi:hypothetical protein